MNVEKLIDSLAKKLEDLPTEWEGKRSILELKEANYNWRQMEWWAFYFEYKARELLKDICQIPGDTVNRVTFDLKKLINFDLKAKAIKSDDHKVILNDTEAMETSIQEHGKHGEIIALCDVEYNDEDRSFQQWHTELKGGLSAYEKDRRERTAVSRYRKTHATLSEIIFVVFSKSDLERLMTMNQGRNANGQPRPPKYMLDLEEIGNFQHWKKEI